MRSGNITKKEYEQFVNENSSTVEFTLHMGIGDKDIWCSFTPSFVRKDLMDKIVYAVKNVIDEDLADGKEGEIKPFYDYEAYLECISEQQNQDSSKVN